MSRVLVDRIAPCEDVSVPGGIYGENASYMTERFPAEVRETVA